jgi:hypothetical protein
MSLNPLRHAVCAALVLGLFFASLPVQAWAPAGERPSLVADFGERQSFLGKLWELLGGFWGVQEKEGVTIDPDGAQGEEATGEEGVTIDPNGAK